MLIGFSTNRLKISQLFQKDQRELHHFFWKAADLLDHTGSNTLLSHREPSKLGTQPTFGKIYYSLASALLMVKETHSTVHVFFMSPWCCDDKEGKMNTQKKLITVLLK